MSAISIPNTGTRLNKGAAFLMLVSPHKQWLEIMAFTGAGLASWTAIEYALHRLVLQGLQPFRRSMLSTIGDNEITAVHAANTMKRRKLSIFGNV
jgi:hypothetical protein